MIRTLLIIGLGGFLGSISRYGVGVLSSNLWGNHFPWGTFIVNILGSFIIGLIYGFSVQQDWLNAELRLFLAIGFCGSFTTFSTFSYDTLQLVNNGQLISTLIYISGSILLGLLAVWGGINATKLL